MLQNEKLFEPYASKSFELDEKHTLHYRHEGSWSVVTISQKPDVTLYEAMNFLDRFVEAFPLTEAIQAEDASQVFNKHRSQVSDLIAKWNKDPSNRD